MAKLTKLPGLAKLQAVVLKAKEGRRQRLVQELIRANSPGAGAVGYVRSRKIARLRRGIAQQKAWRESNRKTGLLSKLKKGDH